VEIRFSTKFSFRLVTRLGVIISAVTPNILPAEDSDVSTSKTVRAFESLSILAQYSPIESAYYHGSIGLDIGAGGIHVQNAGVSTLKNDNSLSEKKAAYMPRVYLNKGTNGPVDLGLMAGQGGNTLGRVYGGHVQWTIFQEFGWPAIALRGAFSRLQSAAAQISCSDGAIVVSKGLLRYFTFTGGIGIQRNQAILNREMAMASLLLTADSSDDELRRLWQQTIIRGGISILLFPPFVSVDGEWSRHGQRDDAYQAKLSVGI
jgi:hypothetical protein